MSERLDFDGFSVILPSGWRDVTDDATFSDPEQPPPVTFARIEGVGALYVQPLLFRAAEQPTADAREVEQLAREWGARRGLDRPLACDSSQRDDGCLASAAYRLGDEFVQVWFLSNGDAVVHASYVCPWSARDDERGPREGLIETLRFA